jgi:hypothetical protein
MQNLLQKKSEKLAELPPQPPKEKSAHIPKVIDSETTPTSSTKISDSHHSRTIHSFQIKRYFLYLPLLFITLILLTVLVFIFQHIEPSTFKNVFIPGFYFPVVALVWATTFFGSTYLLMNFRRGVLISLFISIVFIAQLHHFLSIITFIVLLIPFIGLEISLTRGKSR